jgi:hypothetical protein
MPPIRPTNPFMKNYDTIKIDFTDKHFNNSGINSKKKSTQSEKLMEDEDQDNFDIKKDLPMFYNSSSNFFSTHSDISNLRNSLNESKNAFQSN